jgi:hypothetical protein
LTDEEGGGEEQRREMSYPLRSHCCSIEGKAERPFSSVTALAIWSSR